MKTKLLVMSFLLTLASCGGTENKLTHGKVIDKSYDDPDTDTYLYCAAYDLKTGGCIIYAQGEDYDPAHWKLRIRGTDGDNTEEWHEVSETTYTQTRLGEYWSE